MSLQIGDTAPPFTAPEVVHGVPISLDNYLGKTVVVVFSGLSWCPPCQFEAPILQSLWEVFKPHGQFIVISEDDQSTGNLLNAIDVFGLTMPVIQDDLSIAADWIFNDLPSGGTGWGVPHLFVLQSAPQFPQPPEHHVVCNVHKGASGSEAELTAELAGLIGACASDSGHDPGYWEEFDPIPWLDPGPLRRLGPIQRDVLVSLGIGELAKGLNDRRAALRLERLAADATLAAARKLRQAVRAREIPPRDAPSIVMREVEG